MPYCKDCKHSYWLQDHSQGARILAEGFPRDKMFCQAKYDYIGTSWEYRDSFYEGQVAMKNRNVPVGPNDDASKCPIGMYSGPTVTSSGSSTSSNFCATASCEVLGMPFETILPMYELTKHLIRSGEKDLLREYNRVGPICAEYIRKDRTSAQEFYERAVVPAINFIENKEYEKAQKIYCSIMQEYLEKYSIGYDKNLINY